MSRTTRASSYDRTDADTSGPRLGNGHQILRIDDVYQDGSDAVLTGEVAPMTSEFGDGFFFGVRVEGKTYDLRVKEASPNFARIKAVAPNQRALRGKSIIIGIKNHLDRDYLCILDKKQKPTVAAKAKPRAKSARTPERTF